jgi:hypothetical protein
MVRIMLRTVALTATLLATGGFAALRTVFAACATLTEQSALTLTEPNPQVSTVRGRGAIITFYRHLSADVAGGR